MSKAVHIISGFGSHTKFLFKIILGKQSMAGKRFPTGDIAVRLHPPAPADHPAAFPDSLFNLRKHLRIIFFDPLIKLRGA